MKKRDQCVWKNIACILGKGKGERAYIYDSAQVLELLFGGKYSDTDGP